MEILVLIDEMVCEDISLSKIREELDKESGMDNTVKVLTEYMCNLLSQEQ
jgi:hypothetical protein